MRSTDPSDPELATTDSESLISKFSESCADGRSTSGTVPAILELARIIGQLSIVVHILNLAADLKDA